MQLANAVPSTADLIASFDRILELAQLTDADLAQRLQAARKRFAHPHSELSDIMEQAELRLRRTPRHG